VKIREIMSTDVRTCAPGTSLAVAAALMLDADCGFLPVVEDGKLVGVITDRDMYIALATRSRLASQIVVGEVARTHAFACGPDEEVGAALATMKEHRVRRLPVEGFGGAILGVVSISDIVRAAGPRKGIRSQQIVETLQAICSTHEVTPHVTAA
jgi:CBS domain-containing protein